MKYFFPMILLIGVVGLLGGLNGEGFRNVRKIIFVIGFFLLLAILFAYVIDAAV